MKRPHDSGDYDRYLMYYISGHWDQPTTRHVHGAHESLKEVLLVGFLHEFVHLKRMTTEDLNRRRMAGISDGFPHIWCEAHKAGDARPSAIRRAGAAAPVAT
jgi:hypothetical protein